ncbi:MAG TPA: zf-HC2 domain-containing protein [Pyrinomonadaceae bacterium]|jgi:anti-sigma factor RsiW
MNCEKCQDLLSDFLDDVMDADDRQLLGAHLEECLSCYNVRAEIDSIVGFCRENRGDYLAPPNEQALWLRIRNTIEGELAATTMAAAANPTRRSAPEGWWSRMMGRSWELSLPQVAMAAAALILFVSLGTVFGLRSLQKSSAGAGNAVAGLDGAGGQAAALTASGRKSGPKDRLWQEQQIKYWSQVVEERKGHWNPQMRSDFERNLSLLDETVQDSLNRLSTQPHDEVTEEMLNAALSDKMQLLKEFSDL